MLFYLAAPTYEEGRAFAQSLGLIQLSYIRFTNNSKDDIRLVTHLSDIQPTPHGINIIRSLNFKEHPQYNRFLKLVESGGARWKDL